MYGYRLGVKKIDKINYLNKCICPIRLFESR